MLPLLRQFLLLFVLQVYLNGEASINEEFHNNFQSLYNFMDELRIASDTLQNFFKKVQAMFCPEQPICSSKGIQDRGRVLSTLPQYIDIGTSSIRTENISDIVGICCLPCSCSDNCFKHGYCCLSKLYNRSAIEEERSDISTSKGEEETRSVDDIGDISLNDIIDGVSLKGTSTEMPGRSKCVRPSVKSFDGEAAGSDKLGYFMITSCVDKTINKTQVRKCEEPSADVFDETVPVTSLRTKQTYWNQHCALCNRDGQETVPWRSIGDFGDALVFFANNADVPEFPKTTEELYKFIIYRGDIIHSPPFPMEDKRCLLRLNECEEKGNVIGKNVRDTPWLLEACRQYTSPIEKKLFFTAIQYRKQPFRNIFCFFCRENNMGLVENSRCSLNLEATRFTSTTLTGLIDYKPKAEPKSSLDGQLTLGNGNCLCREIYDKKLDHCRPVLCPPGDFMTGCQCAQLVKNLSGVPVLLYLKVMPESDNLPTMTAKQIRSYNAALSKSLLNTVDEITVEPVATFKQQTETGENFLSLVLVRSNLDHDTKQTLKPFLDYLDSPRKIEMMTGKRAYSVRLTSRVRVWSEWDKQSLTVKSRLVDFDIKEQDPPLVYSGRVKINRIHIYQVLSPLLYCRQVLLEEHEFFEQEGFLVVNGTSPEVSTPYYYRVAPSNARVCVKHFKRSQTNAGAKLGYTVAAMFIMLGYVRLN